MGLGLTDDCRQRLTEELARQLADIGVKNGMFLDPESAPKLFALENILPKKDNKKDKLRRCLEEYVGDTPLFDFLSEYLSKELEDKQRFDGNTPLCRLTELDEYKDVSDVSTRLISAFDSLPWEYCITLKLDSDFGQLFAATFSEYSISESLKLISHYPAFTRDFPLCSDNNPRYILQKTLDRIQLSALSQDSSRNLSYVQIFETGFIGRYTLLPPLRRAISLLKSFCGVALSIRLLEVEESYRPSLPPVGLTVHRQTDNKWAFDSYHELERDTSDTLNRLKLHDLNGALDTPEKQKAWMTKCLSLLKLACTRQQEADKIRCAGEWFFESLCGSNELLSFVQAMVALEIILGDKSKSDMIGLGELLSNRCAYLIGKTRKQREKVLRDFRSIYEVRSSIVHRGKNQLNLDERCLLSELRWICHRVIQEEMNLLSKDVEERA